MCSYLLQDIKVLRERKEYKTLTGVSKKVVKYLLSEVEEMVRDNLIAVNRSRRYRMVHLFELRFEDYTPLGISSIHKSGAAHIKCIMECKGAENQQAIEAIKTVCDILNWRVEMTNRKLHSASLTMNISFEAREEETP